MSEPRSNMNLTDRAGLERYRLDTVVTDLTETANGISSAIHIVKALAKHDTEDKVCALALPAMGDAADYLDDVITALEDGRLGGGETG